MKTSNAMIVNIRNAGLPAPIAAMYEDSVRAIRETMVGAADNDDVATYNEARQLLALLEAQALRFNR